MLNGGRVISNSPCDFPKENAGLGIVRQGMCQTLPRQMHRTPDFTVTLTIILKVVVL